MGATQITITQTQETYSRIAAYSTGEQSNNGSQGMISTIFNIFWDQDGLTGMGWYLEDSRSPFYPDGPTSVDQVTIENTFQGWAERTDKDTKMDFLTSLGQCCV